MSFCNDIIYEIVSFMPFESKYLSRGISKAFYTIAETYIRQNVLYELDIDTPYSVIATKPYTPVVCVKGAGRNISLCADIRQVGTTQKILVYYSIITTRHKICFNFGCVPHDVPWFISGFRPLIYDCINIIRTEFRYTDDIHGVIIYSNTIWYVDSIAHIVYITHNNGIDVYQYKSMSVKADKTYIDNRCIWIDQDDIIYCTPQTHITSLYKNDNPPGTKLFISRSCNECLYVSTKGVVAEGTYELLEH